MYLCLPVAIIFVLLVEVPDLISMAGLTRIGIMSEILLQYILQLQHMDMEEATEIKILETQQLRFSIIKKKKATPCS